MAYRDSVTFIERARPNQIEVVGRECLHTRGVIKSILPVLLGLPAKVHWQSTSGDLAGPRLSEMVRLAEALHDGFDKAGQSLVDYADALREAQRRIRAAIPAEQELKALIAPIVATQSPVVRSSDGLRQWHDLRELTGWSDYLAEVWHQDSIDEIRTRAERLWYMATDGYDRALRVESEARVWTVRELATARRLLPDMPGHLLLAHERGVPARTGPDGKYRIGPPTVPDMLLDSTFRRDPAAEATLGDRLAYVRWLALLGGSTAYPWFYDDAAPAYAHYLFGSGAERRIDYEEAYREDAAIRAAVDTEILIAQREAERLYAATGQTAFQMTGEASQAGDHVAGGYPAATENWQKALGGHYVYGTSDVVVQGNQITMTITVHAADVYNFNAGGEDITTGIDNKDNARFANLGWADEYFTHGELRRTVTWTVGDLPPQSTFAPNEQLRG